MKTDRAWARFCEEQARRVERALNRVPDKMERLELTASRGVKAAPGRKRDGLDAVESRLR
jgi:hypothetical protein